MEWLNALKTYARTIWNIAIARVPVEPTQEIRNHGGLSLVPSSPFDGGRPESIDEPSSRESASPNARRYI